MSALRLALLPTAALSLFAASEIAIPHEHTIIRSIGDLGAFAFLSWFCWYGITKAWPRQNKLYTEEAEKNRTHFSTEAKESRQHDSDMIGRITEAHEKAAAENRQTMERMIGQCAARNKRD